ncbi:MAG: hypothetical protein K8T90_06160 [Planctomycetes bacterium]|nr:hypothetical protein [Planctomycetota bacterium]
MSIRTAHLRLVAGLALGAVLGLAASSALAGSAEGKVAGVGGAEVKWNDVRFRKQLFDQIQPGLTWRLGSGGATKIEVTGMVLASDGVLLFPGEAALNLRFLGGDAWSLVAYEFDAKVQQNYQWDETRHTFGVVPCTAWREKDPKKSAEKLALALRGSTGKSRTTPPASEAVTGGADAKPAPTPAPADATAELSKEARAELDKAPWLELEMRFGDLVGLVLFEAAEVGELKAKKTDDAKTPLSLRWPQFTTVRAKTELAEKGKPVTLGWMQVGTDAAGESLLVVTGGETPKLEFRKPAKEGASKSVEGKRTATKTAPKTTGWECDGKTLTLHLFQVDYSFTLP